MGATNRPDKALKRAADTAPCIGCGMCCDGTMYDKARADPQEKKRLTDAGLRFFSEGGKDWFAHPCRFAQHGICTIYDQRRFRICREYRCKLLRGYQAGEISRGDALMKVQQALALRADVTSRNARAGTWKNRWRVRDKLGPTEQERRLLLAIIALDYYLDTWFRWPTGAGAIERHELSNSVGPDLLPFRKISDIRADNKLI